MSNQTSTEPQQFQNVRPWMIVMGLFAVILAISIGYAASTPSKSTSTETEIIMRASQLAGFTCSQLRDGAPESVMTVWLVEQSAGNEELLREALRRTESQCSELLR